MLLWRAPLAFAEHSDWHFVVRIWVAAANEKCVLGDFAVFPCSPRKETDFGRQPAIPASGTAGVHNTRMGSKLGG